MVERVAGVATRALAHFQMHLGQRSRSGHENYLRRVVPSTRAADAARWPIGPNLANFLKSSLPAESSAPETPLRGALDFFAVCLVITWPCDSHSSQMSLLFVGPGAVHGSVRLCDAFRPSQGPSPWLSCG